MCKIPIPPEGEEAPWCGNLMGLVMADKKNSEENLGYAPLQELFNATSKDELTPGSRTAPAQPRASQYPWSEADLQLVDVHYPKPISVTHILADVALWSGYNFVMDPSLSKDMQIFAPRKLSKTDAFQLFVASLETVGLRALQMDGFIVKIVPCIFGKIAV